MIFTTFTNKSCKMQVEQELYSQFKITPAVADIVGLAQTIAKELKDAGVLVDVPEMQNRYMFETDFGIGLVSAEIAIADSDTYRKAVTKFETLRFLSQTEYIRNENKLEWLVCTSRVAIAAKNGLHFGYMFGIPDKGPCIKTIQDIIRWYYHSPQQDDKDDPQDEEEFNDRPEDPEEGREQDEDEDPEEGREQEEEEGREQDNQAMEEQISYPDSYRRLCETPAKPDITNFAQECMDDLRRYCIECELPPPGEHRLLFEVKMLSCLINLQRKTRGLKQVITSFVIFRFAAATEIIRFNPKFWRQIVKKIEYFAKHGYGFGHMFYLEDKVRAFKSFQEIEELFRPDSFANEEKDL